MSLICRWLFPSLIKQCLKKQRRGYEEDEADVYNEAIRKKKKKSFCFRLFNETTEGDTLKIQYVQIVSGILRLAVFMQLINCSIKLTGVVSWSYYIIIWPYYVFIGASLIFTCGSILLVFSWIC